MAAPLGTETWRVLLMPSNRRNLLAASGNGGTLGYVEDVFSTYLYTGNGSTQTITNGIDLAGEGGMVWIKRRSSTETHRLCSTAAYAYSFGLALQTNTTTRTMDGTLATFNSNGFYLNGTTYGNTGYNTGSATYSSWTFRKAPKFFDEVTYTGTGSATTIAHSLGAVPGMIIVKRIDGGEDDWQVYHRSLTSAAYKLNFNGAVSAQISDTTAWNSTAPTDTVFSVGTNATVNASGWTYVAYIYAHNAGGFGDTGADDIISCGSYEGNGSATGPEVTLGWEPQYILIKNSDTTAGRWYIHDSMRGIATGGSDNILYADLSNAEAASAVLSLTATGYTINTSSTAWNESGSTYIYMAIRRPMKVPEAGTEVFKAISRNGTGAIASVTGVGFAPDSVWPRSESLDAIYIGDRLRGYAYLSSTSTIAEQVSSGGGVTSFNQDGFSLPPSQPNLDTDVYINWCFKRAPGFFDVVCYTGTGVAKTEAHNLGVVPELMIVKGRSNVQNWIVFDSSNGATKYTNLNTTAASAVASVWNNTSPTSTEFSLGTSGAVNASTVTFVAYLFATLAGVSKVGSYTGTGTTLAIDCGFAAGARFVMIKRTDSTGDWYVWDTVRGIIAGNDPYLLMNSTAAEVTSTDYIDPSSAGFEISSTAPAAINASGGTFIYLAIA